MIVRSVLSRLLPRLRITRLSSDARHRHPAVLGKFFRLFPALWHSQVERRAGTVSPAVSANPFRHLRYCTLCGETAAMCECHERGA